MAELTRRSVETARLAKAMPGGALLIIGVEFWERFSYFGMLAIFVLFLTSPAHSGGFGWENGAALGFVGVYAGLMYSLPLLGGVVADRWLGHRRAIGLGSALITLGHLCLAGPVLLPLLIGGRKLIDALEASGVAQGLLYLPAEDKDLLIAAGDAHGFQSNEVMLAYIGITSVFYVAIAFLILGNALMKSTLVIQLGDQFEARDKRREKGYSYYYLSISLGALLSGLVVGTVGERIGWHYGFSIAGVGMAVASLSYNLLAGRLLRQKAEITEGLTRQRRCGEAIPFGDIAIRFFFVIVAGLFLAIFMAGWYQIFGSWTLFTQERVNQNILGFEVPVSWFISLNSIVVILCAPIFAAFWIWLENKGVALSFPAKLSIALAAGGAAHGLFAIAAHGDNPSLLLPLLAIAFLSIGELIAWVPAYGFVYKIAPKGMASSAMGLFYLVTLGVSGYIGGQLGRVGEAHGYEEFFSSLSIGMFVIAFLLVLFLPVIGRGLNSLNAKLENTGPG